MKLLIAFALFAIGVAVADEIIPVRLPEPRAPAFAQNIDIRPLIIPQSVLDAIKAIPFQDSDLLRVNFVDAPIETAAAPESYFDDEGLKVRVVEAPINVPEPVMIAEAPVPEVVEPFVAVEDLEAVDFDNADALRVNFVDSPIEAADTPVVIGEFFSVLVAEEDLRAVDFDNADALRVNFVDSPIEEADAPVVLSESSFSDDEGLKVRFVDSPAQAEEVVKIAEPVVKSEPTVVEATQVVNALRPGKLFADPRLR